MIKDIKFGLLVNFAVDYYQLPKNSPAKSTFMVGIFYVDIYWYRGSTGKL